MPRHTTPLTPKEQRFIAEYLIDGNGKRAAEDAGYAQKNSASVAYQLLQKPHMKAALAKALKDQEKRTLVKSDENLKGLERLARRAEGEGDLSAAITARVWIGKHHKSFTDRLEVRDTTPRADRLAAARARRKASGE